MSVKEKLVDAINNFFGCDAAYFDVNPFDLADHLIARGVRLEEKQVTSDGWIPVTERLPDLIPCDAGTAYSEAVNVLTSGRKVMVAVWDGVDWLCAMDYWDAWGEVITHWTPVILPLPEPSKESAP